jgi:hypothetical protein
MASPTAFTAQVEADLASTRTLLHNAFPPFRTQSIHKRQVAHFQELQLREIITSVINEGAVIICKKTFANSFRVVSELLMPQDAL